jgi:hypothetical protein
MHIHLATSVFLVWYQATCGVVNCPMVIGEASILKEDSNLRNHFHERETHSASAPRVSPCLALMVETMAKK